MSVSDGKDIYGDSDSAEDDSIDVTINVTNVNEAPEFDPNAPADLSVMEDTAADVPIGDPITATDPENDTITYDLDDVDGASFDIDTTGQIKTKDTLDEGTQDTYTITVTASDDNGGESTHQVTITVTEANDPPAFTDENDQSRDEHSPAPSPRTPPRASPSERSGVGHRRGKRLPDLHAGRQLTPPSFDFETATGQIKTKDAAGLRGWHHAVLQQLQYLSTDGKDDGGNAEAPTGGGLHHRRHHQTSPT